MFHSVIPYVHVSPSFEYRGKVTPQSSDKVQSVVHRPSILRGNTQSSRKVSVGCVYIHISMYTMRA